jgi:hypothetical protein
LCGKNGIFLAWFVLRIEGMSEVFVDPSGYPYKAMADSSVNGINACPIKAWSTGAYTGGVVCLK